jgi:hypothetical protein
MSYPKMKYCGLRDDDRCVVRSEEEEAALGPKWADTPAAFYSKIPEGCRKAPAPKPEPEPKPRPEPKPDLPPAEPEIKSPLSKQLEEIQDTRMCRFCGEPGHSAQNCIERKTLGK